MSQNVSEVLVVEYVARTAGHIISTMRNPPTTRHEAYMEALPMLVLSSANNFRFECCRYTGNLTRGELQKIWNKTDRKAMCNKIMNIVYMAYDLSA